MFRTCYIIGFCIAVLVAEKACFGQVPVKAIPIDAAHAGIDRLNEDLDYVFGLAKEPKALKDLKELLNEYFKGLSFYPL